MAKSCTRRRPSLGVSIRSRILDGSMKKFIQENPTIAYGLGLPLLLVVIFLIVSGLPQLLVANPQYELLYATGTHNYPERCADHRGGAKGAGNLPRRCLRERTAALVALQPAIGRRAGNRDHPSGQPGFVWKQIGRSSANAKNNRDRCTPISPA